MKKLLKISFVLFCTFVVSNYASAQSALLKAKDLGQQAVTLEDKGDFDGALKLLAQARQLDPANIAYPYEMAYSLYGKKEYQHAIDTLTHLLQHRDVFARVYQLLGNSYDNMGLTIKASETYDAGLKKFPNAGELYLESAVMLMEKSDYNKALGYCERGISADPTFPSNYYWASKLYCNSSETVWGVMYGEIFMNLERNTKRTAEISKLLYDTYKKCIKVDSSGKKASVDFSKQNVINMDKAQPASKFKLPFNLAYGMPMAAAIVAQKNIDLTSLNAIRTNYLAMYYNMHLDQEYPNVLFSYQNTVKNSGNLEAYNYWLLMMGDEKAFTAWRVANKPQWDKFVAWYNTNPIKIDQTNKFTSGLAN